MPHIKPPIMPREFEREMRESAKQGVVRRYTVWERAVNWLDFDEETLFILKWRIAGYFLGFLLGIIVGYFILK